jgi:glycosyltransferase involved in cell wall biosynthesis
MRILIANNFFGPFGGAELAMFLIYQLLRKEGHDVAFFAVNKQPLFETNYPFSQYFPQYTDFDELKGFGSKLKMLPKLFYNPESESKMRAFLRDFKPDLVHCGNLHYHLTPSVLKACQRENIPVVMTLHDPRMMCPAGTLMQNSESYCQDQPCLNGSPLNCINHRCYNKSLLHSGLVTAEFLYKDLHGLYKTVSHFIAPSEALRTLAGKAGLDKQRISVINNCLAPEFMDILPAEQYGNYFLYVGRLSPEKGVKYLIEAMRNLPPTVALRIIGTGPEEAQLKAQAADMPNVQFLGFMAREELIVEYRHCIASIIPSKWFEVFGLTAIETFACGRPVIGSRIGGIQEIIDEGETGFLVPLESSEALSQAMMALIESPELAQHLGKQALKKARRVYAPSLHIARMLALYSNILTAAA